LEDFFRADKIKIKKILPLGRQLSRGFCFIINLQEFITMRHLTLNQFSFMRPFSFN